MAETNIWDECRKFTLWRPQMMGHPEVEVVKIDPGVNYFILMLEQLGCHTVFSCEGHPRGFYITFVSHYKTALKIQGCGYFTVSIAGEAYWRIDHNEDDIDCMIGGDGVRPHRLRRKFGWRTRAQTLRWAAAAWEKGLGPLKMEAIEKRKEGIAR